MTPLVGEMYLIGSMKIMVDSIRIEHGREVCPSCLFI